MCVKGAPWRCAVAGHGESGNLSDFLNGESITPQFNPASGVSCMSPLPAHGYHSPLAWLLLGTQRFVPTKGHCPACSFLGHHSLDLFLAASCGSLLMCLYGFPRLIPDLFTRGQGTLAVSPGPSMSEEPSPRLSVH